MAKRNYISKLPEKIRRDFTREDLLQFLEYFPDTGVFIWKAHVQCYGGGREPGDEAGSPKDGYVQIMVFGKPYRAHHLAYLVMTGEWPPRGKDMDHINGRRGDNRWRNLRIAARSQNNLNSDVRSDNSTGFKGVHPQADGKGRWFARIGHNGKIKHLGTFDTKDEAIAARKQAEINLYGEFSKHLR